jgi:hypothetical protein
MSVRAVLRMGNPVLLERSGEIQDFNTRELNESLVLIVVNGTQKRVPFHLLC